MTVAIERVAVLGAGSWGTAFAKVLGDAGRSVRLYARRAELADALSATHTNPDYLPGVLLPPSVRATADVDEALDGAQAVVLAFPSQALRDNLAPLGARLPETGPVVSLAKGIEVTTGARMSEVVAQAGEISQRRIVILTGPNLAKEIAAEHPTTTVLAAADLDAAVAVAAASTTDYFRPYLTSDVVGVEIAGTGKNVVALAVGLADGLSLGSNTAAALMTRGLAELTALGMALGAERATFAGLAGLGDLVATCSSPLSRNRAFGRRLGEGMTLSEAAAAASGQVAEGVASCASLWKLAQQAGVPMPITQAVYEVCSGREPAQRVISALMAGPVGAEAG